MYATVLGDPAFFRLLLRIDEELARETRCARCPQCAGPLHAADFPRKPRGCPVAVIEDYSRRFSFTCGRCEQRATSASVRFLGRRVYVAVVLMLVSPPRGHMVRQLSDQLSVPIRTLLRWRRWWTEDFPCTPFWQAARSRFMPALLGTQLPQSLLDRFAADSPIERLTQTLRFLSPLSI